MKISKNEIINVRKVYYKIQNSLFQASIEYDMDDLCILEMFIDGVAENQPHSRPAGRKRG